MDGDQCDNERQSGNQVVTSVGNSWIVGRSTSHTGHVYYFNTETGEAVWNLSEAEIEKAKRLTKSLGNSKKVILENCREPKGSPMDETNNGPFRNRNNVEQRSTPSKIYNKQIINNRFPKHSYPYPSYPSACNHMVSTCGCPNTGTQIGLPFNPNVWAVPQSHQIVISSAPIVGHSQTPPNVVYNNPNQDVLVHNSTVPLNRRMQREPEINNYSLQKNFGGRNNFFPKNKNNRFGQRWEGNSQRKFHNNFSNNHDLRQFLSFKRTLRTSVCNEETEDAEDSNDRFMNSLDEQQTSTAQYRQSEETNEDFYHSDADNDWLEDNLSFKDSKLNLDVTNLKKLANSHAKTNCWYIAVDKTILLSHLNFLNILINSDDQCNLMVPQKVLLELRGTAKDGHNGQMPRLRRRAHRAVSFLCEQLKAGSAKIGDDKTEADDNSDYVVNCCRNLVQLNYHVVLLSNNIELQHYKATSEIPIFTIKELKQFLTTETEDKESSPEPPFLPMSNESVISNNNETRSGNDVTLRENNFEPQRGEDWEIDSQSEIGRKLNKRTIDAEVQTEITPKVLKPKVLRIAVKDNLYVDPASNTQANKIRTQSLNNSNGTNNASQPNKTKTQIRLNRTRPQVSKNDNTVATVEKKQFKWRKRRDVSNSHTNESRPATVSTSDLTTPTNNLKPGPIFIEKDKHGSQVDVGTQLHQMAFELISKESKNIDGNIASSEASSGVIVQSNVEHITIEETSTSGVISNTSNGNSECGSISKVQLIPDTNSEQKDKPVITRMYDVTDQAMEDYLKMRCDEWVARFYQIMEEVLEQILYQYPLEKNDMPPPWTLHEATQCIKMKFSRHKDVEDATTRLSNVLYKLSDSRGKISMNLKPSEFMEMYSYGVYLVNTLQSVISNCQDLQIAAEYLSELLKEIQNPHLDDSHNETFGDNPYESSATISTISDTRSNKRHLDNDFSAVIKETDKQYKLRSKKQNAEQEKPKVQHDKLTKKMESTFFASLNLHKRTVDGTCKVNTNVSDVSSDKDLPLKFQTFSLSKTTEDSSNKPAPTYVRNFKSCPQFEEVLKNSQHMNELDYSTNYDDDDEYDKYIDTNHCSEDDYYDNEQNELIDETNEIRDPNHEAGSNHNKVNEFIRSFLYEVKDSFSRVKRFCEQTVKEFMDSELSISRKKEIHEKAEKANHYVDSLCKSLSSIYYRESPESENNMKSLLRKAGIQELDLMDEQFVAYRDIIANCIENANILLETVNVVITAVKEL